MKTAKLMNQLSKKISAFTLIELAVVLGVLVLLGATLLPAMARVRGTASRVACADNLKQIGLAFNSWKVNHSGQYPMTVGNWGGGPPTGGSTLSAVANTPGNTTASPLEYTVFGVMSNELSTPKILICPSDERTAHSNFTMHLTVTTTPQLAQASASGYGATDAAAETVYFNNFKLSYFLGVNARDLNPQMILAGDRNIWGNYVGTQPAQNNNGYGNPNSVIQWMGTNWPSGATFPQWSPTKMHQSRGNVLQADGSVQQFNSSRFRFQCAMSGDTTTIPGPNTLLFP
jgi:prepilin-type processing-associated H-X9-DG protein